jgi:hypothetical protein
MDPNFGDGSILFYLAGPNQFVFSGPGGDVQYQYGTNWSVTGLRGTSISPNAPAYGQILQFDGAWSPCNLSIPTASNAVPLVAGVPNSGTADDFSRSDHVHPEQSVPVASNVMPEDVGTGSIGTSDDYARADHSHLLNFGTDDPKPLGVESFAGNSGYPAREDHVHVINGDVQPDPGNANLVHVVGLQGKTLSGSQPFGGQVLEYNGVEWIPATYKTQINAAISFLNAPPYNAGLSLIP